MDQPAQGSVVVTPDVDEAEREEEEVAEGDMDDEAKKQIRTEVEKLVVSILNSNILILNINFLSLELW